MKTIMTICANYGRAADALARFEGERFTWAPGIVVPEPYFVSTTESAQDASGHMFSPGGEVTWRQILPLPSDRD